MILKCLGSGSSGNCYLLCRNDEILILDAGIPIKDIKRGLNWQLGGIQGVLCTHGYLDHSKAVKDFENMGIKVWKPFSESNLTDHMKFNSFSVQCFPLSHNGTPNFGLYINADSQKILYLTDYEYCRFNFKSLQVNHIICECNYHKELVKRDLPNYEHKIRGHSSLDYCKRFIPDNKTPAIRTVILCHMGAEMTIAGNVVWQRFKKVVGEGVNVVVARKGLEVELIESRCPF